MSEDMSDHHCHLDFVGIAEAAEIVGVSKQRIHQLAKGEVFPEAAFRLRATPVWRKCDVEAYARYRNRRPGPTRRSRGESGLGWWVISGDAFLIALRRAHEGESPDLLYAEQYANSDVEQVPPSADTTPAS